MLADLQAQYVLGQRATGCGHRVSVREPVAVAVRLNGFAVLAPFSVVNLARVPGRNDQGVFVALDLEATNIEPAFKRLAGFILG